MENPIWNNVSCWASGSPCGLCDAAQLVVNIINFSALMATAVVVFVIAYGAIRIMTSGGSAERFRDGIGIIKGAVLGAVITLSAWAIINTIVISFADSEEIGKGLSAPWQWNNIICANTREK
jgi:hypothetical protein